MTALYAVFEGHTPGLDAKFKDLPDSAWKSSPAVKLGISESTSDMRRLWEDWQSNRTVKARADFDKLLEENQFVGFWAGLKRMGKTEGGDGTVVPGVDSTDADAEEGEEGEGGGGKADLKALAKGIGEKQIEDVLRVRSRLLFSIADADLSPFSHLSTTSDIEFSTMCLKRENDGSRRVHSVLRAFLLLTLALVSPGFHHSHVRSQTVRPRP